VTSGTVFANRKLSFKKIIMAIWEEITAAKGMAALHLSRKLNVQYKTAYVLLQKLREAVGLRRDAIKLHGTVQIDGKYVGGVLRKANKKEERKDGRKKENQNGKDACEAREAFNYERLEFQANAFSSSLLLPSDVFHVAVAVGRSRFDIKDRGHGYIFVDDQPCNFVPYDDLLSDLSQYFEVSKQAIEIKLKKSGLLNDRRQGRERLPTAHLLGALASLKR
jgi:hypothetical protein